MIWFIIVAILAFAVFFFSAFVDREDAIGTAFVIMIIGGLLSFAINILFSGFISKTLIKTGEENLYSLKSKDGVVGSYFLGTGRTNSKVSYFYVVKSDKEGTLWPNTITPYNGWVCISEEKDSKPHVEYYEEKPVYNWRWYFLSCIDLGNTPTFYKFVVPPNTVYQEFSVEK